MGLARPLCYKKIYIIAQVILAFWLVLPYDLLEDNRTIHVIISMFFYRRFKMAESFENLDTILRDWAKDKVQKTLIEALKRKQKKNDKACFFLENDLEKLLEQSQSVIEQD